MVYVALQVLLCPKIEEALEIVCDFMDEIEIYSNKNNSLEKIISFLFKRVGVIFCFRT